MRQTNKKVSIRIKLIALGFIALGWGAGIFLFPQSVTAQEQWNPSSFTSLFPPLTRGWSASDIDVQEPDSLSKQTQVGGLATVLGDAPEVRYLLKRAYSRTNKRIEADIDTENIQLAPLILTANGYNVSAIADGKRVPLTGEEKKASERLRQNGIVPYPGLKNLAMKIESGGVQGLIALIGEDGIISLSCEYKGCFDDIAALMKRADFPLLDKFARFDHRKKTK